MKTYRLNSGQNVIYVDYSTSATGASLYQSSADPSSRANIMRNALILGSETMPISVAPRVAELHPGAIRISEDFDQPLPDEFWTGNA